ncbi:hypothetical protein MMPV_008213 [Pyropia vietnamensis]
MLVSGSSRSVSGGDGHASFTSFMEEGDSDVSVVPFKSAAGGSCAAAPRQELLTSWSTPLSDLVASPVVSLRSLVTTRAAMLAATAGSLGWSLASASSSQYEATVPAAMTVAAAAGGEAMTVGVGDPLVGGGRGVLWVIGGVAVAGGALLLEAALVGAGGIGALRGRGRWGRDAPLSRSPSRGSSSERRRSRSAALTAATSAGAVSPPGWASSPSAVAVWTIAAAASQVAWTAAATVGGLALLWRAGFSWAAPPAVAAAAAAIPATAVPAASGSDSGTRTVAAAVATAPAPPSWRAADVALVGVVLAGGLAEVAVSGWRHRWVYALAGSLGARLASVTAVHVGGGGGGGGGSGGDAAVVATSTTAAWPDAWLPLWVAAAAVGVATGAARDRALVWWRTGQRGGGRRGRRRRGRTRMWRPGRKELRC